MRFKVTDRNTHQPIIKQMKNEIQGHQPIIKEMKNQFQGKISTCPSWSKSKN